MKIEKCYFVGLIMLGALALSGCHGSQGGGEAGPSGNQPSPQVLQQQAAAEQQGLAQQMAQRQQAAQAAQQAGAQAAAQQGQPK